MATTAVGVADFTAAFQKIIQPYIQDNVPAQTKMFKILKKMDNVQVMNNAFQFTVRTNRHGGISNLANDKSKVVTGSSPTTQGTINPEIVTGVFDMSDMVIKASNNDKKAVESSMNFQMRTLTTDFAKSLNRQYQSDGVGIIAMIPESGGSVGNGTIQIQYPNQNVNTYEGRATNYYGTTFGGINGDIKPTKYFAPGNIIGIGSAGTAVGTISSGGTAVQGGTALGTLILTGVTPTPGSAPVYILDGDADAAGTSEIQGVRAALSEGTGNYAGLSRGLDVWSPQILGTSQNQSLTINNMEVVYMSAVEYAREGDRYAWFMNKTLYLKYGDLLTALRRTVDSTELVSGWSGLQFQAGMGKVGVYMDFDMPDGDAVLMNLDTWTICQIADMGFVQDGMLRRADYITFQKVFTYYTNLACVAPAANGRMVRQTK